MKKRVYLAAAVLALQILNSEIVTPALLAVIALAAAYKLLRVMSENNV